MSEFHSAPQPGPLRARAPLERAPLRDRAASEAEELEFLAPFAIKACDSVGRIHPEPRHPYRTDFQRDRDRVLHSRAFRRLEYKTQVFVHHEGDHYRNRLTHTLEGAQIARTVARSLRLNEDLTEAITLAHDLGHTPFGHAGERVLDELMCDEGGFDHNRQSLRVVDLFEERYAGARGLNLTAETREGILKHGCSWQHPVPLPPLGARRSAEAQVANAADEIAYIHHDVDDGLRAGILTESELADSALWRRATAGTSAEGASGGLRRSAALIALVNHLVCDLIESSAVRLREAGIQSVDDVRNAECDQIGLSPETAAEKLSLKRFLLERFYQHPRVRRMTRKAEWVVKDLFLAYLEDPTLMPRWVVDRLEVEGEARAIADYVAGMTDRFAMAEHRRLLDPHESC